MISRIVIDTTEWLLNYLRNAMVYSRNFLWIIPVSRAAHTCLKPSPAFFVDTQRWTASHVALTDAGVEG